MTQYDLNLRDYWRIIRRRKTIVVFVPLLFAFLAFALALFQAPNPLYRATATVRHERAVSMAGLLQELYTFDPQANLSTQAALIKSFPVVSRAAKKLGFIPKDVTPDGIRASPAYLQIIESLPKKLKVKPVANTNLIEIHATSPDPKEAARTANSFAKAFREDNIATRNRQVHDARQFIESQLKDVGGRLRKSEEQVRAFQESNGILFLPEKVKAASARLAAQEAQHEQLQDAITELEMQLRALEGKQDGLLSVSPGGADPTLAKLYASLTELSVERQTFLLTLRPTHPQVKEVDARIENIRGNLIQALSSKLQVLRAKAKASRNAATRLHADKAALPDAVLQMARMQRELKVNDRIYSLLKERLQEALIKEKEQVVEVSVVKPAMIPSAPVNPPNARPKAVVGLLIGLVVGLVLAFVVEALDTSIGAIAEVEALLETSVLGVIPHLDAKAELAEETGEAVTLDRESERKYSFLISLFIPRSRVAEAFRALRTNLLFSGLERDLKTIMITSAAQMEGKTTVAINLAITLAQLGKKTLLVEADLRNPFVHHAFGIPKEPGLAEVVLGTARLDEVTLGFADLMLGKAGVDTVMDSPGIDNLFLMPSGYQPLNPSELLSSQGLDNFLDEARQRYDYVILDSTPILPVADSTVLGSRVDGALTIVQVGRVPRALLRRAKILLESAKTRPLGVCLTGVRSEVSPDYANMAYYHYRYGGERKKAPSTGRLGVLWGHRKRILGSLAVLLALAMGGSTWRAGHANLPSPAGVTSPPVQASLAPSVARAERQPSEPAASAREPIVSPPTASVDSIASEASPPSTPAYSLPKPFTVQLHAFKSEERADQVVAAYRRLDLKAFSTEAVIPGKGQWWRILVGEFDTRAEAETFGQELIRTGAIKNFRVVPTPGAEP